MEKQVCYYMKGQDLASEMVFQPNSLVITNQIVVGEQAQAAGAVCVAVCGEEVSLEGFYPWAELLVENLADLDEKLLERTWCHGKGLPWRVAEGYQIYLQELTPEAVPELYRIYHEPEVTAWVQEMKGTLEEECDRMAAYQKSSYRFYGCGIWGIYRKFDDLLLGSCGLEWKDWNDQTVLELGYVLGKEFHGHGYATEASLLALGYARKQDYGMVRARIAPDNMASRAVAERIGMRQEGSILLEGCEYLVYVTDNIE